MKNNCDVSGPIPFCQDERYGRLDCEYHQSHSGRYRSTCMWKEPYALCTNLAAIRAAIEAERDIEGRAFIDAMGKAATEHIVDANNMMARDCENCKHASLVSILEPCRSCMIAKARYTGWEPAAAGEKVE